MQKTFITFLLLLLNVTLMACPVCEKQQPEILKGITHGAGPESNWDYLIIWAMVDIVLVSLYLSLKWIFRPEVKQQSHIKYTVLNFE
jgi:hypothetical protein